MPNIWVSLRSIIFMTAKYWQHGIHRKSVDTTIACRLIPPRYNRSAGGEPLPQAF